LPFILSGDVQKDLRTSLGALLAPALTWSNMVVAVLNVLYAGGGPGACTLLAPTAAQARMRNML
jgi:hypothetical protein